MLDEVQEDEHRLLGREDVPVVAKSGVPGTRRSRCGVGTLGNGTAWRKARVIEDADHALVHSHGAILAEILRDVLREVELGRVDQAGSGAAGVRSSRIGRWTSAEKAPTATPTHQTAV